VIQNSIVNIDVENRVLLPPQAELWVHVTVAQRGPTTEIRGRFVGPRCEKASTVEVAYPIRPLRRPQDSSNVLTRQVVIPEPSFWDLETPFFYEAIIELWEDGNRVGERRFSHRLRKAGAHYPQSADGG
jgi:hypothetical protein